MEVFNKFYSSVSNTVSQLSGVLPGNPVTREFEATQFIASAGPGKYNENTVLFFTIQLRILIETEFL